MSTSDINDHDTLQVDATKPATHPSQTSIPMSFSDLFSKEDPLHLHKTLGLCCLLSFLVRFGYGVDSSFRRVPSLTLPTLLLHGILSASSFLFRIPNRRIKEGSRIWPEFRIHSLVFASRSLLQLVSLHIGHRHPLLVVLGTMAGADGASSSTAHRSRSVRDLDASPFTKLFFSYCQFLATSTVLYDLDTYTIPFCQLSLIQCTAFTMTLRRKDIVSHNTTVVLYGLYLVAIVLTIARIYYEAASHSLRILTIVFWTGTLAFAGRVHLGMNKFVVWTLLYYAILQPLKTTTNYKPKETTAAALITFGITLYLALGSTEKKKEPPFETKPMNATKAD